MLLYYFLQDKIIITTKNKMSYFVLNPIRNPPLFDQIPLLKNLFSFQIKTFELKSNKYIKLVSKILELRT